MCQASGWVLGLQWGAGHRPCAGGELPDLLGKHTHMNRQLQHNVISVLSCLWAKYAAAKAGPLEVAAVGQEYAVPR